MIDLSQMRSVRIDPMKRMARAEGGARWRDFDHETQALYLALATTDNLFPRWRRYYWKGRA